MASGGVVAVLVAAGRGHRAGGERPKQYRSVNGRPVIRMALEAFLQHPGVAKVQPVIHPEDTDLYAEATAGLKPLATVSGAATRQASVHAGLEAVTGLAPEIVLVHDAARPFASASLIDRAIDAARRCGAAVPGLAVVDAIKLIDGDMRINADNGTIERSRLRLAQTPQAFRFAALLEAHRQAAAQGRHDFADDAAVAAWAGMDVSVFEGEAGNVKLTTESDFLLAEKNTRERLTDIRIGSGFDVHAFGPGDQVTLGGISIPHERGLSGHSDADVVLHALTDAVLGALADGDIGQHFPPSDAQWRGAASDQFLAFAADRVRGRGGIIAMLDVTILCEAPRIGPHRDAMRARIAEIARLPQSRVAVKATTTERLGFLGRGEGIAAFATATLRLPEEGHDCGPIAQPRSCGA